jgi:hypothetical protein
MTPSSGLAPGIATVPWTVAEPEPAPITIYDEDGSLSPTTTAVGPGEARAANRSGARSRYGRIGTVGARAGGGLSMFGFGGATRMYLAAGTTDMRKSFEGLYGMARDRLRCDPLSGHVFLFWRSTRFAGWPGSSLKMSG